MFRVLDLEASVDFYQQALDMVISDRISFEDFTLVYLRNEEVDFEIELTYNFGNTEPYSHGTGYGHLAVSVNDLEDTHKKLLDLGFEPKPIKKLKIHDSCEICFFFLTDPDGYQIEFIQRSGRFMIQKH